MVSYPARHQIRGKKFVAKAPSSVKVQLLQSIPGYGKKGNLIPSFKILVMLVMFHYMSNTCIGSIVPITPGVMRNIWYPREMATYVTISRLQELGGKDITAERDPLFGSNKQRKAAERERREAKVAAAMPQGDTAAEADLVQDIDLQSTAETHITEAHIVEPHINVASSTLVETQIPLLATEGTSPPVAEPLAESPSSPIEPPKDLLMTVRSITNRMCIKMLLTIKYSPNWQLAYYPSYFRSP